MAVGELVGLLIWRERGRAEQAGEKIRADCSAAHAVSLQDSATSNQKWFFRRGTMNIPPGTFELSSLQNS
jgi:hypothetical protein